MTERIPVPIPAVADREARAALPRCQQTYQGPTWETRRRSWCRSPIGRGKSPYASICPRRRAKAVKNWFETRRRPRNNPAGDVAATASRVRAREGDNNNDDDDDDDDVEIAKPVRKKAKVDEPAGEKTEDAADESAAKVTQA